MRVWIVLASAALLALIEAPLAQTAPSKNDAVRTGPASLDDWRSDAPGVRRRITSADLPGPLATPSSANSPHEVARPSGATLKVPAGFAVAEFASGLKGPRVIRVAPNGDIFVAETEAGRVHVFRPGTGAAAARAIRSEVFASGLDAPYGIAFYPPGPSPQFIYIATVTEVLRFRYRAGDVVASGEPETIVSSLPRGGHTTRDLVFSPDGRTMFVSVGSGSNFGETMPTLSGKALTDFEQAHALGAAWDSELDRATVLAFDPDGGNRRTFATGIRNCAGLTVEPANGDLWCAVNERDELGDDLPPDYATSVRQGRFYGWPWFYTGSHPDPRQKGAPADLVDHVTVPDVLFQAHSAPLGITFYQGGQFPSDYTGDAFVALHGSWNRAKRTGYKVVRLPFKDGRPTGEYEDFLIGFVADSANVWGKPVDVAVAPDGSLLVTDNVGGLIWRVSYRSP